MKNEYQAALQQVHKLTNDQWATIKRFFNGEVTIQEGAELFGISEVACLIIKHQFDPLDSLFGWSHAKEILAPFNKYYVLPYKAMLDLMKTLHTEGVTKEDLIDYYQFEPVHVNGLL